MKINLWPSWGFKTWHTEQINSFSFEQNKLMGTSGWMGHLVGIGTYKSIFSFLWLFFLFFYE